MSERLVVDPIACVGHGLCVDLFPEWITYDDWGYPIIDPRPVPGTPRRARPPGRRDVPGPCARASCRSGDALTSAYAAGMTRVLVIEDDSAIADPLLRALRREGYEAVRCSEGAQALAAVNGGVDLVVLDLGLPDVDGVSVCRELRRVDATLPVIMLTARSGELDVIVGLDAGADDYVTKPFRLGELLARIRARVRTRSLTNLRVRDVEVDVSSRRAWRAEEELELTAKEFDLLALLVRRAGTVVTREDIMESVWDEHWFGSTRTLDVHMSWLRKKLGEDASATPYITTRCAESASGSRRTDRCAAESCGRR